MRRIAAVLALASLALPPAASADPRPRPPLDAAQIRLALERLQVTGSALYVAAHPDDENTAALAWLANGRKVRTAYLSLTRGDGGQNLLGTETGELLGVIRTQELLAARRVDGAEQMFTRALDFGFSKNADETLAKWDHERILADVVWAIRRFQPDVILTRFPPDSTAGHGHHTSSALLAEEAFTAAADPARFREQLGRVRPWRARRLLWNVFRFGSAGPDTTPGRIAADLGEFDRLLGRSYTEIAGESRSFHKSQGFGSAERRGAWLNTFQHRLGERAANDLFDGVDLTWNRVPGGARVGARLAEAARRFDAADPAAIVPTLLEARAALATLADGPLVRAKRAELDRVIAAAAGLWVEAIAARPAVAPGRSVRVVVSVLERGTAPAEVRRIEIASGLQLPGGPPSVAPGAPARLARNVPRSDTLAITIPDDAPLDGPYWLQSPARPGSFEVADPARIGAPENDPLLVARVTLGLGGAAFVLETPVVYRWVDPVEGERYRDLVVVPPASLRIEDGALLFAGDGPREVGVAVQATDGAVAGEVRLALPDGWSAAPAAIPVALGRTDADTTVRFRVTPGPGSGVARAVLRSGGREHDRRLVRIDYPHIPVQTVLSPAEARLVRTPLALTAREVAYLMGSGDQVPSALEQMGARVTPIHDEDLDAADWARFDAVVIGVRAYNTRPRLRAMQGRLLDYVANGGRLVIQYQTADAELQDRLGPWPFRISRERVTVEEAAMRPLAAAHPLLNVPNRIGPDDFSGWVQERGLYYASPWDPRYETVLSANDPGEPPRDGGILFARYGKGAFIYTGLAFFRQLPAGVPGAWRLFANLVSPTSR